MVLWLFPIYGKVKVMFHSPPTSQKSFKPSPSFGPCPAAPPPSRVGRRFYSSDTPTFQGPTGDEVTSFMKWWKKNDIGSLLLDGLAVWLTAIFCLPCFWENAWEIAISNGSRDCTSGKRQKIGTPIPTWSKNTCFKIFPEEQRLISDCTPSAISSRKACFLQAMLNDQRVSKKGVMTND